MAAQGNGEVEQDLSHIHWSFPEAIAANPERSLATSDLAMDYFARSPFWDTKSNNNVLRTQRSVGNPFYGHAEEKIELNAFNSGFEYVVAHSQPPSFFIIHRRDVQRDYGRANVSAAYFVLDGKVYPIPTLYDVMATRLKNATHLVSSTFSTLSSAHPPANPRAPSQWRSLPPTARAPTRPPPEAALTPAPPDDADDDVTMDPVVASIASVKRDAPAPPDWHLFHALQTTRSSLAELDRLAKSPPPIRDPTAELKAIEAQVIGSVRSPSAQPRTGDGRTPADSSPSVRFGPASGKGRAPSNSAALRP